MTRPTVLDMDLVVVPREATLPIVSAYSEKQDEYGISHFANARVVYPAMLSASPYPTAWEAVRKYVEGLEEKVAFTMTDTSRMLRKPDIEDVCPHPDDCFYESERVRCGPCAVKASKLAGIEIDDTHSHLPEVCRLRREVKAAEARIAELEKRLADAERVIEPFAERAGKLDGIWKDHETQWSPEYGNTAITIGHLRAARAYMEGK